MKRKSLKIDRLEIRLKGVPLQTAAASVSGLGPELLHQLARSSGPLQQSHGARIDAIDAGTLPVERSTGAPVLRRMIVNKIDEAIASKVSR